METIKQENTLYSLKLCPQIKIMYIKNGTWLQWSVVISFSPAEWMHDRLCIGDAELPSPISWKLGNIIALHQSSGKSKYKPTLKKKNL